MNALDICAGSGIGSWVWKQLGGRTVCYVENDDYCQRLLQARIVDGLICDAPIWDDLRSFDGRPWRGRVDFIFGGIPCQPWSVAGQQQGEADERDLWPDTRRIICEIQPRFVLVENVPGLLARGMGRILGELAESGYDAEWDCIPASAVGAPHRRDRVWLVAYPLRSGSSRAMAESESTRRGLERDTCGDGEAGNVAYPSSTGARLETHRGSGQGREPTDTSQPKILRQGDRPSSAAGVDAAGEDVANSTRAQDNQRRRRELAQETGGGQSVNTAAGLGGEDGADADASGWNGRARDFGQGRGAEPTDGDWWAVEPDVGRVAHGVASRVDRLRILGNGQVPQVAEVVMRRILEVA